MADMKHYIITRFNLPLNYRVKGAAGESPGLDPSYLKERFELFERFTIPSMEAQTCKDFRWVVLFDERTPEPFRSRIDDYGKYPWFEAVFAGEGFSLKAFVDNNIKNDTKAGVTNVLTTRLDNDDALMPDFVQSVQSAAKQVFPADRYLTSPVYYQYDVKARAVITRRLKKNHFISRTGNVFEVGQMRLPMDPAAYVKVPGRHAVEIIHGTNVINSAKFSPGCILGRDEYEGLKDTVGHDLQEYGSYRSFCRKKIRQDFPVYIKYQLSKIPRVIKKIKETK